MMPDSPPAAQIASGLADLVEIFRADLRDLEGRLRSDIGDVEDRLTAKIDTGTFNHAKLHDEERVERREIHGKLAEFIRSRELAEARRDGALGALRFTVELVSRHSGQLGYLAGALAVILGFLTGTLRVEVGP